MTLKERDTYVVETGTNGNSDGSESAETTTRSSGVFSLDTQAGVSDTSDEQSGVGGVDERSRGTVQFSEEDEEESEGSRLGEVAVGTNGALKLSDIGGVGNLLLARTSNLVGIGGAKVDVGVETLNNDVSRKVGVVSCEEGRVCQGGLSRRKSKKVEREMT